MATPAQAEVSPTTRLVLDVGPLVLFFLTNWKFDLLTATGVFMVAILIALGVSWALEKRVTHMAWVTAVVVVVFGGLTLLSKNPLFFLLKPTVVNTFFAAVLFGGLLAGRALLKPLLGSALQLQDEGWRVLTYRWAWFFVFLAVVNTVIVVMVRREVVTEDFWVNFKVFGIMPMTILFTLTQVPLITRHQIEAVPETEAGAEPETEKSSAPGS